jgi:hypothetical protein
MRQLQLKRFNTIFKSRKTALANLENNKSQYKDGEMVLAAYYSSSAKTADSIMYIVGIYADKDNKKKLFTIDVESIENDILKIKEFIEKVIDIILDDEKVISASENNLNDHINDLSGKTITEITSKDNSVTVTKGEDTANDTISVDLKVDPSKISALDLPLGLEYTPRRTGGNATLKLISTTDKTKQSIDVSDFVIDKMVKKVELISGGTIVRITWNADTTADSVDGESSDTDTTVYTDVNLKDIAQYYIFNPTATSGSNVAFTTSINNETGVRTISGNVTTIDCGEYEGE